MNLIEMMENPIKRMQVIFYALLLGVLGFAGFVGYELLFGRFKPSNDSDFANNFKLAAFAFAIVSYSGAHLISNVQLKKAITTVDLKDKLKKYTDINIIRFASIKGSFMFTLVVLMFTGNLLILLLFAMLLALYFSKKPSLEKTINELNLNMDEAHQLKNDKIRL